MFNIPDRSLDARRLTSRSRVSSLIEAESRPAWRAASGAWGGTAAARTRRISGGRRTARPEGARLTDAVPPPRRAACGGFFPRLGARGRRPFSVASSRDTCRTATYAGGYARDVETLRMKHAIRRQSPL